MKETRDVTDLERIIVRMIMAYPFFGTVISKLPKSYSEAIPTAAIAWDNRYNKFNMLLNKKFFEALPDRQKIGLLVHEVMHFVNMHIQRVKEDIIMSQKVLADSENYTKEEIEKHYLNMELLNVAQDFAINQLIQKEDGQGHYNYNGIDSELPCQTIEIDGKEQEIKPITRESIEQICKPGTDVEYNQPAEHYYNLMKQNMRDDIKEKGGTICVPCKGGSGGGSDDGETFIKPLDDHSQHTPDAKSGQSQGSIESQINKQVNEAARMIKQARSDARQRSAGNEPGWLSDMIDNLLEACVDWRGLLRHSVGTRMTVERDISYSRRNRRTKQVPGFKKMQKETIVVAQDTSGSISGDDIKKMYSELESLLEDQTESEVYLAQIDTSIKQFDTYRRGDWENIEVCGGGGTDMRPIFEAVFNRKIKSKDRDGNDIEQYLEADRLILFTDGYLWDKIPDEYLRAYPITIIYTQDHSEEYFDTEAHKNINKAVMM